MPTTSTVIVDPSWSIGDKPHGGYLLSTVVAAALDADHPHPMAVSAHYLSPPSESGAVVEVDRLRTGRRVATSRVRLVQDGTSRVEALVTTGRYDAAAEPFFSSGAPPVLPPVEDCPRAPSTRRDGLTIGFLDHVEMRMDPATVGYASGTPGGRAANQGWLRRADGADPSVLDLLVFADALPPVTFDLGLMGWVPTVELTVLLRALPAPGWVRATQHASLLQDGWLDEDVQLWDSAGRLVGQARQLAGYRA